MNFLLKLFLIFLLPVFSSNCDKIRIGTPGKLLKQVEVHSLKIPEPSGLSLAQDNKHLWVVSDRNSAVYLMNLKGEVVKRFKVSAYDLEGITVINQNTLAVLSEETSEIIIVDTSGNESERYVLKADTKKFTNLEGLTFDKNKNRFFAVNKRAPPVLIMFDADFKNIKHLREDFFNDLSGIAYCPDCECLWILSDGDKSIIKYKLNEDLTGGEFLERYKTNIRQAEGISVDCENRRIYVVSDYTEKLYIFEME